VLLTRSAAIAVAVATTACGPGAGPACQAPGGGAALQLVYVDEYGELHDLADGARVPLIFAPQGGLIMLVGARVEGLGDCHVQMTGALRDPCNNRVVGLEQRPITLVDRDGWGEPRDPGELSSLPNVAVCPPQAASQDVDGHTFQVEILVTTDDGQPIGEATALVVPTCSDDGCRCECDTVPGNCDPEPDAATACPGPDASPF
jgi:hypothetical protein